MVKKHLGKGLRALIPEPLQNELASESTFSEIPINRIVRNPLQPREKLSPEGIESLRRSIEEQGVLQPIVVRPAQAGYELIAGERRWTAAKQAGLSKIPARIIQNKTPVELLEISLVENLQREDLNPIDLARGYNRLANEFELTHQDIARRVGSERSTVTNLLRLLHLPEEIQQCIRQGEISMGHARALLSLPTKEEQLAALREIIKGRLSVRQTETLRPRKKSKGKASKADEELSPELKSVEDQIRLLFGTKVQIRRKKKEGFIQIFFYSDAEFERVFELLQSVDNK